MRKIASIIFVSILFKLAIANILCAQNNENHYLLDYVTEQAEHGKIIHPPLMVIDGVPLTWDDWLNSPYVLPEEEIAQIFVIGKQDEASLSVYGEIAGNGVLLIQTRENAEKTEKERIPKPEKLLYIVDGNPVEHEFLSILNPALIESITVIRDPLKIKEFSDEEYDGAIIISTKMGELKQDKKDTD